MSRVDITLNISLDDFELIKVGKNIYTTHQSIYREQPNLHFISEEGLQILKKYEGELTSDIIEEWLILSKALDQTCGYSNQWDDNKILQELIKGEKHPVSWYVHNCEAVYFPI